jgi:anti-anti-sigma factor
MAPDAGNPDPSGGGVHAGQVSVGHEAPGIAVVTMRGEHDLTTRGELARALELAAAHSSVIVDLSDCTFIDSTVIQELAKSSQLVSANGDRFAVVIPPEHRPVRRIAALTRLGQILPLYESRQAAVAGVQRDSGSEQQGPEGA